jgi:predicted branched-subunit amino acid permease
MTFLAYAGTAQLASLPLIVAAAPVWVVVLTAVVVNLRFVIYSLALRKPFARESSRKRLVLGYLTGDIGFVRFMTLLENEPRYPHPARYFLGGATCNWLWWQAGSLAGIFAAGVIPRDSGLEFAGLLAILTLLVPLCARVPALGGVAMAGAASIAAHDWPLRLGVLAAIVAGVAVAVALEAAQSGRRRGRA